MRLILNQKPQGSNHSTYQRMWAAMESASPSVFAVNNAEGIERVVKGNRMYAFLMESTSIEYSVERNCKLMQVGGWLDSKGYGIALPMSRCFTRMAITVMVHFLKTLPTDSPYRTHISQAVLKLQEEGKLNQLKQKWWMEGMEAAIHLWNNWRRIKVPFCFYIQKMHVTLKRHQKVTIHRNWKWQMSVVVSWYYSAVSALQFYWEFTNSSGTYTAFQWNIR